MATVDARPSQPAQATQGAPLAPPPVPVFGPAQATPIPAPHPPGMTPARWHYVDEARTHEIHAGLRMAPTLQFVIKESAFRSGEPGETLETIINLEAHWEAALELETLEKRLLSLGRYWRWDTMKPGWQLCRGDWLTSRASPRPVSPGVYKGAAQIHLFHTKLGKDVVFVGLRQTLPQGERYLIARADFQFPNSQDGLLVVVHEHLPAVLYRSLLAREEIALGHKGATKVQEPGQFAFIYGKQWHQETHVVIDAILTRMANGELGEGRKEKTTRPIDPLYTDFQRALTDPRLIALHARFFDPDEEKAVLDGGEIAIKASVVKKRPAVPAQDQHLLSIVEASLLARDGLRAGRRAHVDEEVSALVRRFANYL